MFSIQFILLLISGFAAGFVTAAAYVAFIAMLGIFPKIAAKTQTAGQCIVYENCLMIGILLSTLLQFFINYHSAGLSEIQLPARTLGLLLLILIGFFGGIYIGFLLGGLSEILNVIPAYARKTHLQNKIGYIIYFIALGKGVFTLLQFLIIESPT